MAEVTAEAIGHSATTRGVVQGLTDVQKYLADTRDAPYDAPRLCGGLERLITLLSQTLKDLEDPDQRIDTEFRTVVNLVLRKSSIICEELRTIFDPRSQINLKNAQKQMLWTIKKPNIEKIIAEIEKINTDITLLYSIWQIRDSAKQTINDTSNKSDALQNVEAASYQATLDALEHAAPGRFRTLAISNALKRLDFQPLDHYAFTLTLEKVDRTVSKLANTDQF
jgi:hypothetical protein